MDAPIVRLYRYRLPLAKPLRLRGTEIHEREGLILVFGGSYGTGYGDIAPLPGFSRETIEEAQEAVVRWAEMLGQLPKAAAEREESLAFLETVPSVEFGIECATFSFRHAIGSERSLGLYNPARRMVSVNGLIGGTGDPLAEAKRFRAEGHRAVKLKVGQESVAADIGRVHAVRAALPIEVALRLDANRAWTWQDAMAFAHGIQDVSIEYIEEPLSDPDRLPAFAAQGDLAVALDETIVERRDTKGLGRCFPWAAAFVLKPTLIGGVRRCERIANEALEFGIRPVVSACFESGIGIAALAHFASALTTEDIPAGLDTYDWLAADVSPRRFAIRNGRLDLEEADACVAESDFSALEEVYRG